MLVDKSIKYHAERQMSRQWKGFLGALAAELGVQLDRDDLRKLMLRIGARFADGCELGQCATLDQLQERVNLIWADLDWGWVEFAEGDDLLGIQHLCSPLRTAFGDACSSWSPAFLEGAYQRWFEIVGIDPGLRVQQVGSLDDENRAIFKLSRA